MNIRKVYDYNFYGGDRMVGWGGGSSAGCLKWFGGGGESLRDLSKNILKRGVGKGREYILDILVQPACFSPLTY